MNQKIVLTRQILVAVLISFSAIAFVSCEKYDWKPKEADLTTPVSFQNDIIPIFTSNNCTGCHQNGGQNPNLSLSSENVYTILIGGYINKVNPASSKIYAHLLTSPHDSRCSVDDRNKILAWITQGALDN